MSIDYIKISGAQTEFNGKYFPCLASISDFQNPSQVHCKKCDSNDDDDNKYCIFLHKITERWIICKTKFDPKSYYYAEWDSQSNEPPQSGWKDCTSTYNSTRYQFGSPVQWSMNVQTFTVDKKKVRLFDASKVFLSESFSDVHFHCPDGTILHAHKLILAQTSSYFATFFEGPWDQQHPDGIWETTNSADDMKFILSYIYGFECKDGDLKEKNLVKLSLAHEYNLKDLLVCIEDILSRTIDVSNVKDFLLSADQLNLKVLKKACFVFVKEKGYSLVMDKSFAAMMENEKLWYELRSYLADNKHNNMPNNPRRV